MQKELSIEDMAGLREVFSQAKSFDATDIYILQDRVPRLGRLKDYYPMSESSEITQANIEQFTLTTMADRKNGAAKEHYSHSEYAFSIKEHGRYRVSSTRSEEGIGLSIRKLPYFIPALREYAMSCLHESLSSDTLSRNLIVFRAFDVWSVANTR